MNSCLLETKPDSMNNCSVETKAYQLLFIEPGIDSVVIRTGVSEQLLDRDGCLKYLIERGLYEQSLEGGKSSIASLQRRQQLL